VRSGRLAAGTKNLKDHRKPLLERRAIIARRSVQPASAAITAAVSFIYHSARAKERGIRIRILTCASHSQSPVQSPAKVRREVSAVRPSIAGKLAANKRRMKSHAEVGCASTRARPVNPPAKKGAESLRSPLFAVCCLLFRLRSTRFALFLGKGQTGQSFGVLGLNRGQLVRIEAQSFQNGGSDLAGFDQIVKCGRLVLRV